MLANFDRVASPTRKQDAITRLHRNWDNIPLPVRRTGSNSDDGSFRQWAARRRGRKEDARGSFLFDSSVSELVYAK
jgi:hypothetical protein